VSVGRPAIHDDILHKIRQGLDICNSNNGELTTGKNQGDSASAHSVCKGGGPDVDVRNNVKCKIRGGLNVSNSINGELTPGKKQGELVSMHNVCKWGRPDHSTWQVEWSPQ